MNVTKHVGEFQNRYSKKSERESHEQIDIKHTKAKTGKARILPISKVEEQDSSSDYSSYESSSSDDNVVHDVPPSIIEKDLRGIFSML